MRPRELALRGFRSYADDATFEFAGRTLVGVVGPIGSGKSSILDAVAFALYGKTPRVERDTKSLINQRRDSLHVSLTFEVDGVTWRAVRSLRRNGQSAHVLYRVDDDGEKEVSDRVRDMAERIEAILGLDFDAFRRSVLLAQNQFAQFLEATPTERATVLKGVFGFERLDAMRDAAKRRLDGLWAGLQVLAERRSSAESDRAALPDNQQALAAASERAARLRALREEVAVVDEDIRDASGEVERAAESLAGLDALSDLIPGPEPSGEVLRAASVADDAVTASVGALEEAAAAAAAARERHAHALDEAGGQDALDAAADLVGRLEAARSEAQRGRVRLEEATAAVEGLEQAMAAAVAAGEAAAEAAARAGAAVMEASSTEAEARRAVHAAHDADRVHALRSGLVEGEPCPVCEQVVLAVPGLGPGAEIGEAETALAAATSVLESARGGETAARAAMAKAESGREAVTARLEEAREGARSAAADASIAEDAAADLASQLAGLVGEGDPAQRLAAQRAGVARAAAEAAEAAEAEAAARTAVDEAREARERARAGLDSLRSALANVAGRLGSDVTVGEGAASVEEGIRRLRDDWVSRRVAAAARVADAEDGLGVLEQRRGQILDDAGLSPGDDLIAVLEEANRAMTVLATEVEVVEKRLAELDRLDEEEAGLVEQAALLERLHTDLRPSGFLDFVLAERRRALADLAGDHLESLTAGRYRFSDDGEFFMLDLSAAEGRRAPASLSGGETFLASLALALALAEIVGRQGGRLDAFFLDEGFGSLDPEHIDLAMDGIERLVTAGPGRLVVVVSHVEAMRDRIDDLIVLSRHPITDHTVIESGAVP